MKLSNFTLKIEKSCTENWSSMTVNDAGKFCSNCQKNVIDFSTCSDEEVIRILEKLDGKICGRLQKNQLERIFIATKNKKVSPHLNKILAGLFALGMLESSDVKAQKTSDDQTVLQNKISMVGNDNHVQHQEPQQQVVAKDTTSNFISGKVLVDGTNTPAGFVNIHIVGNPVYVQTDSLGNFKLHVPDSLMTDSIMLEVIYPYYITAGAKVAKTNLHDAVAIVVKEEEMMMGEMIAYPQPKPKKGKSKK